MKYIFSYFVKKVLFLAIFFINTGLLVELKAMEETTEESSQLESLPNELLMNIALNFFPETITDPSQIVEGFKKLSKLMLTNTRFYDLVHSSYFLGLLEKKLISATESSYILSSPLISWRRIKDKAFAAVLRKANDQFDLMVDADGAIYSKNIEEFKKVIAQIDERNFYIPYDKYDKNAGVDEVGEPIVTYIKIPALDEAITSGGKDFVAAMLEHGADPNIKFSDGFTPLTRASTLPQPMGTEIVEVLLSKGANINQMDRLGETPLGTAAKSGNYKLVSLLIKKGANIEARDARGLTPLLYSARVDRSANLADQLETALTLIKMGADINAQANDGKTALIFAVEYDSPPMVGLLLKYGANTELRDATGNTALSIAKEQNNTRTLELLARYKK